MGPRRIDRETGLAGGMKLPFRGHRTARCAVRLVGVHATHFCNALAPLRRTQRIGMATGCKHVDMAGNA